ncbi:MAG: peptidase M14 [Blastocatellia bacterium]|nr:peptidase M14 [Blastocatellia bacterium]
MKPATLIAFILLMLGVEVMTQTPQELAELWEKEHVSKKSPSDVRHADLKLALQSLKQQGIKIDEVGRSGAGREIYQMEFGRGLLKIFMWSQMHGDEPTATSGLLDMFAILQKNRSLPWVRKISESITLRAIPMLNPDGADAYTRRNLQNIDINRDALALETPEARLLKKLRDDWNPSIGFNLHNQQELTTAGRTSRQAAISLLVVYGDEVKTTTPGHERNTRLASSIVTALNAFIPGHIGKYSDEWSPSAFGDNFSAWGTPTLLIETGALAGKDERFLVKMNFIAFVTALNALASGSETTASMALYESLPNNVSGNLAHFVFRRAGTPPAAAELPKPPVDIVAVRERRRSQFVAPVKIRSLSSASTVAGLEEYDASAFYIVCRYGQLRPGNFAEFSFYRKDRAVDFMSNDLEKSYPPDAIFSTGKWIKGKGVVPQIR